MSSSRNGAAGIDAASVKVGFCDSKCVGQVIARSKWAVSSKNRIDVTLQCEQNKQTNKQEIDTSDPLGMCFPPVIS